MQKRFAIAFVVGLLVIGAAAQPTAQKEPRPASGITVTIPGLNCSTPAGTGSFMADSWSWGASSTIDSSKAGGGATTFRSSVSALSVTRQSDGCSPALLGGVMSGTAYKALLLKQVSADGVPTATVELVNVHLTSWQIGGTSTALAASEALSVQFGRFTFTDETSGASFCWDLERLLPC